MKKNFILHYPLIIEKTDANGNKSSYSYDRNNKTLLTDMVDSQTYYALEGNTVVQKAVTTKENNKYDTYGNVIQSTDVDGSITEYTYDYNNNDRSGKKSTGYYEDNRCQWCSDSK